MRRTARPRPVPPPLWTRATWMRAGAVSALLAVLMLGYSARLGYGGGEAGRVRLGAQLHLIHAMATFACATFMNIGATEARRAPPAFLLGGLLLALPAYAGVLGANVPDGPVQAAGLVAVAIGWLTLAWAARTIDLSS